MEPITPIDVARLEERRKAVAVSEIALEAEPIMGGWMCYSAPGGWENQALGLGLDGPVTGADADRLVAYYVSRGVEPKVELCPFADESLTRELSARGFTVREFDNVLFLDLRDPGAIGRLPRLAKLDLPSDRRAAHLTYAAKYGWPETPERDAPEVWYYRVVPRD